MDCATAIGSFSLGIAGWAFVVSIMRRRPIITPCHEHEDGGPRWWFANNANSQYPVVDIYLGPSEYCKIGYGGTELEADGPIESITHPKLFVDKKKSRVKWYSYICPTRETQYVHLVLTAQTDPAGPNQQVNNHDGAR